MQLKLPSFFQGLKFTVGMGIAVIIAIFVLRLECENQRLRKQVERGDTTQVGIVIQPPAVNNENADSTKTKTKIVKKKKTLPDSTQVLEIHHYPYAVTYIHQPLFDLELRINTMPVDSTRDSIDVKFDIKYARWKLILRFSDRYNFKNGFRIETDPAGIIGQPVVDWGNYTATKKPRSFGLAAGGGVFFHKPVVAGGLQIKKYTFIYVQGDKSRGFLILRSF